MPQADSKHLVPSWRAFVPRFLVRNHAAFQRRHERYTCVMLASMEVVESGAKFDGVILEISSGGCSFRPASLYLLDRGETDIIIETEHFKVRGVIRATRPHSYGVQFLETLDADTLSLMVELHGGAAAESFLARQ